MRSLALMVALVGCNGSGDTSDVYVPISETDLDEDGFTAQYDCDDDNPEIYPGADEKCDGVDNDCDDEVDEDGSEAKTWYLDRDRDGYGDFDSTSKRGCDEPADNNYAQEDAGADCNDQDAAVNPAAMEVCGDRIDNDCDGVQDEEDENTDPDSFGSWYLDLDGDGYGGDTSIVQGCSRPVLTPDSGDTGGVTADYASETGDCDDTDPYTFPGAGYRDDSTACMTDADVDGYGDIEAVSPVIAGTDCNDGASWVYPSTRADLEICDGLDSNCDGSLGDTEVDGDNDLYVGCVIDDVGWFGDSIDGGSDCDDTKAEVNPGATEECNSADDDCDGIVDEAGASGESVWYPDDDGDGFGDINATYTGYAPQDSGDTGAPETVNLIVDSCDDPSSSALAYVQNQSDCDDTSSAVNPGVSELCSTTGVDDNCDGDVDENTAADVAQWYADSDNDGYGDRYGTALNACTQPSGYVSDATDCNDGVLDINPGAQETCNNQDDDCDLLTDGDDPSVLGDLWYYDQDGDGYGDPDNTTRSCTQPTGYYANSEDCDDGDSDVNPDATEICRDGADNDCNGSQDQCDLAVSGALASGGSAIYGGSAGIGMGLAAAGTADFDGDEARDLLVGLPGDDTAATDAGALGIYYGPVSGTLGAADLVGFYQGTTQGYQAGSMLLTMTALSGGAESDFIIGSCPDPSVAADSAGQVDFFFDFTVASTTGSLSGADLTFAGENSTDLFGCSGAIAGDQNSDSGIDFIVGAPGYSSARGAFYVVYGTLTGTSTLSSNSSIVVGETAGDEAAADVAAYQDVNGDGFNDVLVSATQAQGTTRGRGYLVLGPISADTTLAASGISFQGEALGDLAGSGVGLADLNSDGYADVIIGAPGNDDGGTDAGAAYILYGPLTADKALANADAQVTGATAGDAVGTAVINAGDIDNNAIDDVAIGAPSATVGGTAAGAVYLHFGSTSTVSGSYTISTLLTGEYTGASAGEAAGQTLFAVGDVDDDTWDDLLVGAPSDATNGTDAGAFYLLSGNGY